LFRADHLLEKKSTLFGIVVLGVVGALAIPIIVPHIFHGFHILHISLHVGGITLAAFLTILGILAYNRLRTKRLLLTMIAFFVFVASESVVLIDATWPTLYDIGLLSLLEVGHLLIITSMGLLAMGVFRND
jgi:hypothetical protein